MATAIAEIIKEAMVYIDDVRLQEMISTNPALFYRKMNDYVSAAMPLLSSPPELLSHIEGRLVPAEYDDYEWVSTEASTTAATAVSTGCIGYDLCSVVAVYDDGMTSQYKDFVYVKETGVVTFAEQSLSGIHYAIDFYNDGSVADLTYSQKRLFGLAIAIVWNERFVNNWLNIQPKVKDSSFQTVNESNFMDKLTLRMIAMRQEFQDEMRKYEQDNAYRNVNKAYSQWQLL